MIELEHSPLGGSGADRWINCAGSFLMHRALAEAGELEIIESDYAKKGTAAHELGALCLTKEREPYEFIGWKIGNYVVGAPDGIDPDAVSIYVTECERLWPRDGKGEALIEQTIALPDIHPHLRGTVDFGYWSSKRGMHLRDYKNGEGIGVKAANNRQMLYYGFIMAMSRPWLSEGPRDLPVTLGIVQPNFYGVFDEPDVWETNLGTVLDWGRDELLPRMKSLTATQDVAESDFVPGEHCQFCPVLLDCPKMQKAYQKFVDGEEFIEMLSNEEIAAYYAERPHARRFMNALDDVVKARLLGGSSIPSAKLVETRVNRVWKTDAIPALEAAFGDKAYSPRKIKSPAQIEKLSSRGKEMATEYGYKPESDRFSIASIDDPRPAAKPPTNSEVFKDFQQSPEEQGF